MVARDVGLEGDLVSLRVHLRLRLAVERLAVGLASPICFVCVFGGQLAELGDVAEHPEDLAVETLVEVLGEDVGDGEVGGDEGEGEEVAHRGAVLFGAEVGGGLEGGEAGVEGVSLLGVALEEKEEGATQVEEHAEGLETGVGLEVHHVDDEGDDELGEHGEQHGRVELARRVLADHGEGVAGEEEEALGRLLVAEEEREPVGELGLAQTRPHAVLDVGAQGQQVEGALDGAQLARPRHARHRDPHSEGALVGAETRVEAADLVPHALLFVLDHDEGVEVGLLLAELGPGLDGSSVAAPWVATHELVGHLDSLSDLAFLVLDVVWELEEEGLELEEDREHGVATRPAFVESLAG